MKKIIGLDLGTTTVGWSYMKVPENENETLEVVDSDPRIIPTALNKTEFDAYQQGNAVTINADRRKYRSSRTVKKRYKERRRDLTNLCIECGFIKDRSELTSCESTKFFQTLKARAAAVTEKVSLQELARILVQINKKRGYKSNRKLNKADTESAGSVDVAMKIRTGGMNPSQYTYSRMQAGNFAVPSYFKSDLVNELDRIWNFQKRFYPDILTDELWKELAGKKQRDTISILKKHGIEQDDCKEASANEKKMNIAKWGVDAICEQIPLSRLATVIAVLKSKIGATSEMLDTLGDHTIILTINNWSIGQYLMEIVKKNSNARISNIRFYRNDYANEFSMIWNKQAEFYPELTDELKKKFHDIIFFQRPRPSMKHLVNYCELESREIEVVKNGKKTKVTTGSRVCPKSSPLFQEFRIWQTLNNIQVKDAHTKDSRRLSVDEMNTLASELETREKLDKSEVLKILDMNPNCFDINYKKIPGNKTQAALLNAYLSVIESVENEPFDVENASGSRLMDYVKNSFEKNGFNTSVLHFNSGADDISKDGMYMLWHLLYSYAGDNSRLGFESLITKVREMFNFDNDDQAKAVVGVMLEEDYGNLSAKAMKKILPFMKTGLEYDRACEQAGYNFSKTSIQKSEYGNQVLLEHLELLRKNSLRNPIAEKIINQMINIVNMLIDKYGKPDGFCVELARELKNSIKRRKEIYERNQKAEEYNNRIKDIISKPPFNCPYPSEQKNIDRYKLYEELEPNGFRTLYSGTLIKPEELFSKKFNREHIIPQARTTDNSLSNLTLELETSNSDKSSMTAYDYVRSIGKTEEYEQNVKRIFENYSPALIKKRGLPENYGKTKAKNLMTTSEEIPSGFIERDLKLTQFITKKCAEILQQLVGIENVRFTTGQVTSQLREDWGLNDMLKELNMDRLEASGNVYEVKDANGNTVKKVNNFTKRNDHRNHALDAIIIACTTQDHIEYMNNKSSKSKKNGQIYKIIKTKMHRDDKGKLRFNPPVPYDVFHSIVKNAMENMIVSHNKKLSPVTTGKSVSKDGTVTKNVVPRGPLHDDTLYGQRTVNSISYVMVSDGKDGLSNSIIDCIANQSYRDAIKQRLADFSTLKKAFGKDNNVIDNPIWLDKIHSAKVPPFVKIVETEKIFTIRKKLDKNMFKLHTFKINGTELVEGKNKKHISDAFCEPYASHIKCLMLSGTCKTLKCAIERSGADFIYWLDEDTFVSFKSVRELVIDKACADAIIRRIVDSKCDLKAAFENIDNNPIWIDGKHTRFVNRVTTKAFITDNSSVQIRNGKTSVKTNNNHTAALYMKPDGTVEMVVVSFFDSVNKSVRKKPVIDKEFNKELGWKFIMSFVKNDIVILKNDETGFDPKQIDLTDRSNNSLIVPNAYRIQKFSDNMCMLRHINDTTTEIGPAGNFKYLTGKKNLRILADAAKVKVDSIGHIRLETECM